ncbi:hypothetical protein [Puniceicoccus vermicola]|uniref:Uncharacterized protein n=1 Tax=Puniceicoccus vermicola TaxID=388746 RepID=A0A7X1AZV2_9BACT|nr:hypothetical protein [Puniceicoccus vermicola]MBC2602957.1 hypothetical protein [Puniceicoccus vermicola]
MKLLTYGIISAPILAVGLYLFLSPKSHSSISTEDVDSSFTVSSEAPLALWSSGSAYALVTGEVNGTGLVRVVGNHGRDLKEFTVGPGIVELAYGGGEMWIEDFHLSYQPLSASQGHLTASVYCGTKMSETDWKRYHEILRKK